MISRSSSHQTFLREVELRQVRLLQGTFVFFGSQADIAVSVFREVSKKYGASLDVVATVVGCSGSDFRRTVCGCRHFCVFQIVCEILQPLRKISQTVVRISIVIPLFVFFLERERREVLVYLVCLAPVSLKPDRHVALRLDLMRTCPATSMLRTNWYQNWMTTLEQQEVRNCPFCK